MFLYDMLRTMLKKLEKFKRFRKITMVRAFIKGKCLPMFRITNRDGKLFNKAKINNLSQVKITFETF